METLGFAGFALGFLVMIWYLTRLLTATGRNDSDQHGGGPGGRSTGF